MKIGIAYDLKTDYVSENLSSEELAELDQPETIEAIAKALISQGHTVEKIGHIKQLTQALVSGRRWDLAFSIAEGIHGVGREAAIPCLLDAYQIPYVFSDPVVLSICLHKGITKTIIKHLQIPTADFIVVATTDDLNKVNLPYPLFIKPIAEGTGKGISEKSIVYSSFELHTAVEELLKKFHQPVLIETYLSGREFTVGIIGTGSSAKVLGIMEVHFGETAMGNIYSYHNKAHYENKIHYSLLSENDLFHRIEKISLDAWSGLGCRDGGRIDIRCDEKGNPMFIEVNPLAGLHPIDSDLVILCRLNHIPYTNLIKMILDSACSRLQLC